MDCLSDFNIWVQRARITVLGTGGGGSSMAVVAADVVAVVEVAVVPMLPAINEMKCTNSQRFWPNGQRFWGSDASEGVPKQRNSIFFQDKKNAKYPN